jgi:ankyrin repeat protein
MSGVGDLHDAIRNRMDARGLSKMLKKKSVPVNYQESDTLQTPLHVACSEGKVDIVKLLVKAGANPNLRDCSGWTPLHCACKNGDLRICEVLLQCKNIDCEIVTIEKTNVLYYFVRKQPSNEEVSSFSFSFSFFFFSFSLLFS